MPSLRFDALVARPVGVDEAVKPEAGGEDDQDANNPDADPGFGPLQNKVTHISTIRATTAA
jgi:hypothetical protein